MRKPQVILKLANQAPANDYDCLTIFARFAGSSGRDYLLTRHVGRDTISFNNLRGRYYYRLAVMVGYVLRYEGLGDLLSNDF